ncbi:MAG: YdcF family protein [Hyphomicrobiales bacterium]
MAKPDEHNQSDKDKGARVGAPAMRVDANAGQNTEKGQSGLLKFALRLCAIAMVLYFVGFAYFAHKVSNMSEGVPPNADGIVVLTGGPARIASGVKLLDDGKGERLLISGVHEATTPQALAAQLENSKKFFDCCIDLGKQALNTQGNAMEAAEWAKKKDYKSVVVVTAAYHLPRALAQFAHYMPNVQLIPHAVLPKAGSAESKVSPQRIMLIFSEYTKFLLAHATNTLGAKSSGSLAQTGGS